MPSKPKPHQVDRTVEIFAILTNGNLQTVRIELDAAFEVRNSFRDMFEARGHNDTCEVVSATLTYNPANVIKAL